MGSDGLCSLTSLNFPKITEVWVIDRIKVWEVVYLVATDLPPTAKVGEYWNKNESLKISIKKILGSRFTKDE